MRKLASSLDGMASLSMVAAAAVFIWSMVNNGGVGTVGGAGAAPSAVGPAVENIDSAEPLDILERSGAKGASNAKVALVEFSDYQCPFCAKHATTTLKDIQASFVDTGKVRYVFLNLPLENIHPFALKGAQAAECAARGGQFWNMHDRLFAEQKSLNESFFLETAQQLSLSKQTFSDCVASPATENIIRSDISLALGLGITGTPTFLVGEIKDGKVYPKQKIAGAAAFATFKGAIDSLLDATKNTGISPFGVVRSAFR